MSALDTIRKVQAHDEPTARLLLEMALFDAVCDEADRVRPRLEAEVSKAMSEKAAQGLRHLARQPRTPDTIQAAEALIELQEIAKRGDDWDWHGKDPGERDPETGQFAPKNGGLRRGLFNALAFATGGRKEDQGMKARSHGALGSWAGPDADNYSRLRSLGSGLIATQDPHARPVGTVARLIGDIGPEAQRHLEPGIRRTAYRYRGTERRPDATLAAQAPALAAGVYDMTPEELKEQGAVSHDQARLRLLSDLGAAYLLPQIPDRETAAISLAAGKMPPSVGVMFDAKGRVVTQAQGFNGDHYLPFDLSNLKRMKGGSYVRTRTTGGPTDEDIYAGLMTGARHLTVISNSGTFTMEFQPDLRGGRRYSDKARQMVDRYARLVGAIGSGELYQRELPAERIATLRAEALAASPTDAKTAREIFDRRKKEALAASAFASGDEDELRAKAAANIRAQKEPGKGTFAQQVEEEFRRLRAEDQSKNARIYRLDGEGYRAALKALKTEFPYYIRSATFLPLQRYMEERGLATPGAPRRPSGGTDMGYTPRGGLSPNGARDLGAPPGRRSGGAEAKPKDGETPKTSGGGGAGTGTGGAGAAPAGLDAVLTKGIEEKAQDFRNALQTTLRARMAITPQQGQQLWNQAPVLSNGQAMSEEVALGELGDVYVEWLSNKHNGDWTAITKHILDAKDPRVLKKVEDGLKIVRDTLKSMNGGFPANYPEKAFDEAEKMLAQIKVLKQPFKPGGYDPAYVPGMGEDLPQLHPEVAALDPSNQALTAFGLRPEHEAAFKQAVEWHKNGVGHEQIAKTVGDAAKKLKALKEFNDKGVFPSSQMDTQENREAAALLKSLNGRDPVSLAVDNGYKAWALKRLQEIREITGTNRSAAGGAADPFSKAAGAASQPSRVRFLDPFSPEAQVLSRALVAKRRSPSPRRVTAPASR